MFHRVTFMDPAQLNIPFDSISHSAKLVSFYVHLKFSIRTFLKCIVKYIFILAGIKNCTTLYFKIENLYHKIKIIIIQFWIIWLILSKYINYYTINRNKFILIKINYIDISNFISYIN